MPVPATWVLCSLKPTGIFSSDDGAGLSEAEAVKGNEPRATARAKAAATRRRDLGRRNLTVLSKRCEGKRRMRARCPPRRDGRSEGFDEAAVDDEVDAGDGADTDQLVQGHERESLQGTVRSGAARRRRRPTRRR